MYPRAARPAPECPSDDHDEHIDVGLDHGTAAEVTPMGGTLRSAPGYTQAMMFAVSMDFAGVVGSVLMRCWSHARTGVAVVIRATSGDGGYRAVAASAGRRGSRLPTCTR
jgi:hypothetical protein